MNFQRLFGVLWPPADQEAGEHTHYLGERGSEAAALAAGLRGMNSGCGHGTLVCCLCSASSSCGRSWSLSLLMSQPRLHCPRGTPVLLLSTPCSRVSLFICSQYFWTISPGFLLLNYTPQIRIQKPFCPEQPLGPEE